MDKSVAYGFGQMGSAYLGDTDVFTPPTGKVVVAITILQSGTSFQSLVGDTSGYVDGTTGANLAGSTAFIQTTAVGANGTNADNLANTINFPLGLTIYGRWTSVDLNTGRAILYFGPSNTRN